MTDKPETGKPIKISAHYDCDVITVKHLRAILSVFSDTSDVVGWRAIEIHHKFPRIGEEKRDD